MSFDPDSLGIGECFIILCIFCYALFKCLSWWMACAMLVGSIALFYLFLKHRYSYWKNRQIRGPPPSLLFGHTMALKRGFKTIDAEWTKEYGSVIGTYMFGKPDLIISDLEILRHVLVKDFSHFVNRRRRPGQKVGDESNQLLAKALTVLEGQHWKDVRKTITPAFTTGKMKNMVHIFNECLKILGDIVSEYALEKNSMDLKNVCGGFTMDTIAKAAFAIDVDTQRDLNNPFTKFAKEIFALKLKDWRVVLLLLFPETLAKLQSMFNFQLLFAEADAFFTETLTKVMNQRAKQPKAAKPDFLQLLLNALESEQGDKSDIDSEIVHENLNGKRIKLTLRETIAQCFLFILGGYETSAVTLHFALYLLALHPDIQEKCVEEVNQVLDDTDEITYEHVQKLHYIEQVVLETLRMYSPVQRINRECLKDITIDGLKIERGVAISAPIYVIHYDEKNYPNPQMYDPDRFTPEAKAQRDPLSYLPFGFGPRNCIGMRFAQMEIKMALAFLIKRFSFTPSDSSAVSDSDRVLSGAICSQKVHVWILQNVQYGL
uniref:Uncharacterized protein n=1 Tax=Plectus sambesii TaxID=2011161 RepID=A0A914W278_9BILA